LRLALIADLHANLPALDAVLADIRQQEAGRIICLGDIATIGPQPGLIIDKIRSLNCSCIMGNHDAVLLNPEQTVKYQIAPELESSLQWCLGQLTQPDLDFLQSFKPAIEIMLQADTSMLCYHGSPDSSTGTIVSITPAEELEKYLAGGTIRIMAGGHTHNQMMRQHRSVIFVNPGSVGCPFLQQPEKAMVPTVLPWAEYAIITLTGGNISIDLRRISFNLDLFRDILNASDLPVKNWWLQQYLNK
jgi:putative phosphoesterase